MKSENIVFLGLSFQKQRDLIWPHIGSKFNLHHLRKTSEGLMMTVLTSKLGNANPEAKLYSSPISSSSLQGSVNLFCKTWTIIWIAIFDLYISDSLRYLQRIHKSLLILAIFSISDQCLACSPLHSTHFHILNLELSNS